MLKPLPSVDLEYIFEQTAHVWQELKGNRIFITGGTGFFGRWLLESFMWANENLKLNSQAVILTRDISAFSKVCPHIVTYPHFSFIQGDIKNFVSPSGSFTHIIHAATDASAKLNEENPIDMLETIIQGTWHTLNFAESVRAKKFLLISSGAVYGKQPTDLSHIDEAYPGAPLIYDKQTAYAQGKRIAEHIAMQYALKNTLEIKIARCFAFVGPHLPLDQHFAIGNFIRDALNGGPIRVKGDGTPLRSYLYAADLTIWLWNILCHGKAIYPYNVGSADAISILELANLIANLFSPKLEVQVAQSHLQNQLPARYVPAVSRAQEELKLPVQIDLSNAIEKTFTWLCSSREVCI